MAEGGGRAENDNGGAVAPPYDCMRQRPYKRGKSCTVV
jgi:hypothetical protein